MQKVLLVLIIFWGAVVVTAAATAAPSVPKATEPKLSEFGAVVHGDRSLNAYVRTVDQVVAWDHGPGFDPFQVASQVINDRNFNQISHTREFSEAEQTAELPR